MSGKAVKFIDSCSNSPTLPIKALSGKAVKSIDSCYNFPTLPIKALSGKAIKSLLSNITIIPINDLSGKTDKSGFMFQLSNCTNQSFVRLQLGIKVCGYDVPIATPQHSQSKFVRRWFSNYARIDIYLQIIWKNESFKNREQTKLKNARLHSHKSARLSFMKNIISEKFNHLVKFCNKAIIFLLVD